jgi:hypothetical protein
MVALGLIQHTSINVVSRPQIELLQETNDDTERYCNTGRFIMVFVFALICSFFAYITTTIIIFATQV